MIGNTKSEINAARRRAQARVETRPPNIGRNDDGKINCWRPIPKATLKDIDGATVEFTAVKSFVFRRRRYGELIRAEIAQTVTTQEEAEEELQFLFSVLRD